MGVQIKPEHLLELHRRRALVPLLRIVQRPPRTPTAVPVAASAVGGYTEYRTPLDLVITAAQAGHLGDPGLQPFRRWDGGLPLPSHRRIHRYPSVFLKPVPAACTATNRATRSQHDRHAGRRRSPDLHTRSPYPGRGCCAGWMPSLGYPAQRPGYALPAQDSPSCPSWPRVGWEERRQVVSEVSELATALPWGA